MHADLDAVEKLSVIKKSAYISGPQLFQIAQAFSA